MDVAEVGEILDEVAEQRYLGLVLGLGMTERRLKAAGDVRPQLPARLDPLKPHDAVAGVLEEAGLREMVCPKAATRRSFSPFFARRQSAA